MLGASTMALIGWWALKHKLSDHFFSRSEGRALAALIEKMTTEQSKAATQARDADQRSQRLEQQQARQFDMMMLEFRDIKESMRLTREQQVTHTSEIKTLFAQGGKGQ